MTRLRTTGPTLHAAASWTAKLCPSRPSAPVLAGVVVDASRDTTVTLSAFDYDTSGTVAMAANVAERGRFLVSGALLAGVARTILTSSQDVDVSVDDTYATVTVGRSSWKLPLLRLDDYPTLPEVPDATAKIDAGELVRAIGRVAPVTTMDTPFYGAVDVRGEVGGPLLLSATDRHRLAVAEIDWTPADDGIERTSVPSSLLKHMAAAIRDSAATETVALHAGGGLIGITTATHQITGRVLDVSLDGLKYRMAPDAALTASAVVHVEELRHAVDRVSVVLDQKGHVVAHLDLDGMTMFPMEAERGGAEQHCSLIDYQGDHQVIAFAAKYLRDALDGLESDVALLSFARGHFLLRPADEDQTPRPGYDHMVMQIRVPESAAGAA